MQNWATMSAADFHTDGVQMDLLAGIEGDGCGTISLDEIADEAETAPAVEIAERADGALFGLAATDEPADGALFGLVAA